MAHNPAPDPFYSILGRAQWNTAYVNRLPDSAFLHVESGGKKDPSGRTTPRSLRHLPVYDMDGQLDIAHLRNAIAQIPKAGPWLTGALKTSLTDKARKLLEQAQGTTHKSAAQVPDWALGIVRFLDMLEAIGVERDSALGQWSDVMLQKRAKAFVKAFKGSATKADSKVAKAIEGVLRKKAALHNAAYPSPVQKTKLSTLKAVFSRGTSAHVASGRPTVMSRAQWGFERVAAFLHLLGHQNAKAQHYAADNDLLPEGHPISPRTKKGTNAPAKVVAKDADELADDEAEHRFFQGIPVVIDRPKGFVQHGPSWERTYTQNYGYIPSTLGGDGEELDVFVLDNASSQNAYWCVQTRDDGRFDEYKVVLGADSEEQARACYVAHIPEKFLASVYVTTVDMLRACLGLEPREALLVSQPRPHLAVTQKGDVTLTIVPHAAPDAGESSICMSPVEYESLAKLARAVQAVLPQEAKLRSDDLQGGIAGLQAAEGEALIVSPRDPFALNANELAEALRGIEQPWLLEVPDTSAARAAFQPIGVSWTLADGPGRLFVSSFKPSDPNLVSYVSDEKDELQKSDVQFCQIAKAAEVAEEQFVLGPVLIPGKFDLQGDRLSVAEVRKTAHDWMAYYQNMGREHAVSPEQINDFRADVSGLMNGKILPVQSYLTLDDGYVCGRFYPAGTWMLGAIFVDDDLWAQVKRGEINGWSIGGYAKRNPVVPRSVPQAQAA